MTKAAMLRVSPETRDQVNAVAASDFGGASHDETVRHLLEEHWRAKAIAAMDAFRRDDPEGWAAYLAEADEWDAVSAPVTEPWGDKATAA